MASGSDTIAALRFVHPDFDADAQSGLTLANGGQLGLVHDEQALRQSIVMLLSTIPGERLRRPQYGCDLHLLAFAPNDDTTHGLAMHYVRRAIETWEPRVEVLSIDTRRDELASERMLIDLRYSARRTGHEETLSMTFDLTEAAVSP